MRQGGEEREAMTQRWRRKAQDVQAILRRKGEEVWWRVRGLVSKEGHAYYLPNEWRDVSIEQFEREYEPVPEHNEYGPDCVRTNGRLNDALESLQLADKLAEAVLQQRDMIPYAHWDAALSEYLESRGKGKGE